MFDDLDRIAGQAARPLRLGLLAFGIAAVGFLFALVIDYGPENPLSYLAFAVVAFGVFLGFVAIAWGWVAIFLSLVRRNRGGGKNAP